MIGQPLCSKVLVERLNMATTMSRYTAAPPLGNQGHSRLWAFLIAFIGLPAVWQFCGPKELSEHHNGRENSILERYDNQYSSFWILYRQQGSSHYEASDPLPLEEANVEGLAQWISNTTCQCFLHQGEAMQQCPAAIDPTFQVTQCGAADAIGQCIELVRHSKLLPEQSEKIILFPGYSCSCYQYELYSSDVR